MSTDIRHCFHHSIISYAVLVYYVFNVSLHETEDLLVGKGISVSSFACH